MTTHYIGIKDIAEFLEVSDTTMRNWANVYDTPEPDITCGPSKMRGWLPQRLPEWQNWYTQHLLTRDEKYVRSGRKLA